VWLNGAARASRGASSGSPRKRRAKSIRSRDGGASASIGDAATDGGGDPSAAVTEGEGV